VVSASSALPEVIGAAGVAAVDSAQDFATGLAALLDVDERERSDAARRRAERFAWPTAVDPRSGRREVAVRSVECGRKERAAPRQPPPGSGSPRPAPAESPRVTRVRQEADTNRMLSDAPDAPGCDRWRVRDQTANRPHSDARIRWTAR